MGDVVAAAERARKEGDGARALELYGKALEVAGTDEDASRRIRLLRALTLVEQEEFASGAGELDELLPHLEGRDEIEALFGLARASMWLEETDKALASAERALELADETGDGEMRGPSLGLLSQVYGQRGGAGDLHLALELGDRALNEWVPDTRASDLAAHATLHALTNYWLGSYARAVELGQAGGDGASTGLALVGLGRHEDAIEACDSAIESGRELDSAIASAYALNCSTAALRDLIDLSEARRRNEEAKDLFGRIGFESGVMQSDMDLLYTDLIDGQLTGAADAWPSLWERVRDATGWERWLAPGRLSVARAEIALAQGRWQDAEEAALEAIEIARSIERVKYVVSARIVLGAAQLELGREKEAITELEAAVKGADRLGHPPTRWQSRAALGRALYAVGNDEGAAGASSEAADIIRKFTATLHPEHAESVLASPATQDILDAGD